MAQPPPDYDEAEARSAAEHRSETPRAEKLRVRWRPEVDFCVPVYCVGAVAEMALFCGAVCKQASWYHDYHQPVMLTCWCLPITVILGMVTLSPLDEESLHDDPDYASADPQRRATAVQRQLRYAELLWKGCVWVNTVACAALAAAYGFVARGVGSAPAAARVPRALLAYAAAMACVFGLATAGNLSALRRAATFGRRAFAAGLDSLSREAEALLGAGGVPVGAGEQLGGGAPADTGEPAGAGLRRRRGGDAQVQAAPLAPAQGAPPGLALAAGRQFLQGSLGRPGLEDVLAQLGVQLSASPTLERLVAEHERTGDGDWPEFARALEEAMRGMAEVPPRPLEEPAPGPVQEDRGQA